MTWRPDPADDLAGPQEAVVAVAPKRLDVEEDPAQAPARSRAGSADMAARIGARRRRPRPARRGHRPLARTRLPFGHGPLRRRLVLAGDRRRPDAAPAARRARRRATSPSSAPATPGLWTAYYLLKRQPGLRIVIAEGEIAGFGASGRNGAWCAPDLNISMDRLARLHGEDAARRIQQATYDAVDEVGRVAAARGHRRRLPQGRRAARRPRAAPRPGDRGRLPRVRALRLRRPLPAPRRGRRGREGPDRRRGAPGSGRRSGGGRPPGGASSAAWPPLVERMGARIVERTPVSDFRAAVPGRPARRPPPSSRPAARSGHRSSSSPARRTWSAWRSSTASSCRCTRSSSSPSRSTTPAGPRSAGPAARWSRRPASRSTTSRAPPTVGSSSAVAARRTASAHRSATPTTATTRPTRCSAASSGPGSRCSATSASRTPGAVRSACRATGTRRSPSTRGAGSPPPAATSVTASRRRTSPGARWPTWSRASAALSPSCRWSTTAARTGRSSRSAGSASATRRARCRASIAASEATGRPPTGRSLAERIASH